MPQVGTELWVCRCRRVCQIWAPAFKVSRASMRSSVGYPWMENALELSHVSTVASTLATVTYDMARA